MMAMAAVLLWSCQEKDGLGSAAGSVELAGSVVDGQILAAAEGGEFSVDVTSSGDWRVSGLADWVTVSAESGKSGEPVVFTVLPNDEPVVRTATFKVFSAAAVQPVTIVQEPVYGMTLLSDAAVEFNADANKLYVKLESNIEEFTYDFGGANWLSFEKVDDVFGNKVLTFDVKRSQDFNSRATVLTLGGANSSQTLTIDVNQAQRDTAFVVGEQRIVKGLEAISVDLVIKSNVEISYTYPSWLTETEGESVESDANGLRSKSTNFSAEASAGSRSATISFKKGSTVVGSVFIKQQNPNPVFVTIPDENLRYLLQSSGYLIDEGGQCELLGAGMEATSLVIGSTNANTSSADPINSIEGLEGFPNLESLSLWNLTIPKVDVSNFPKLNELNITNLNKMTEINTGNRPITHLKHGYGTYTYVTISDIVIKGENLEDVDFSVIDNYYVDYEYSLNSIDVTGCPKLKTLNVKRTNSWGDSALKYLYMTAAQAETVSVTKVDKVEIVVR